MRRTAAAGVAPAAAVLGLFLCFGLVIASFFPFLSVYLAGRGLTPDRIGLLLAAMALIRIVAMPVLGHVADTRIGRRRALQFALFGMAVSAAFASLLDGQTAAWIGAAGIAFAMAAANPNVDAIGLVELGEEGWPITVASEGGRACPTRPPAWASARSSRRSASPSRSRSTPRRPS